MEHSLPVPPATVSRAFVRWLATFVVLLGLVFVAFEWEDLRGALRQASWEPFPFALATIAVSHVAKSLSFARVSRLLGVRLSIRELVPVGFVSNVINSIVSSGGAAGYSVRYALLSRYGVSFSQVVAVTVLHFLFTSVIMVGMLPVGMLYLVSHAAIPGGLARLLTALAILVIVGDVLGLLLVFSGRLRGTLFAGLERTARRLARREISGTLAGLDAPVSAGATAMRRRPSEIAWLAILIAIDWSASVATLYFAFRALGMTLSPWTTVSGFVIGVVAGASSMVPGGLGVQEGTMAGVFALFGLDLDRSVLAAVFYRATYFILPYLISLGLYRWMLRQLPRPEGEG